MPAPCYAAKETVASGRDPARDAVAVAPKGQAGYDQHQKAREKEQHQVSGGQAQQGTVEDLVEEGLGDVQWATGRRPRRSLRR